ncbi:MAG: MaoC family dehydratase N-terminal domain-containing protein [Caulobacteraceae bacterium]|nr:MaoC family dehydratase N-terminal domain-containing protein [Caulobacteraceae bacterium]
MDDFSDWVGRSETADDMATDAPLRGLAALLDHAEPPWPTETAPPLAHWLYFLPRAAQSQIDRDGHPRRGGLLPPVPLPRRMWAGGRLSFLRPIPVGAALHRTSTIQNVQAKEGASGRMVFVTVRHQVESDGDEVLVEEQDIVYRAPPSPGASAAPARPENPIGPARRTRRHLADETQLFRFSALTFNSHRIHYDRPYATGEEGYPGLVVQGPYLATLLMHHALEEIAGTQVRDFRFRAERPVFDGQPFDLNLADAPGGLSLWVSDAEGQAAMRAQIAFA